MAKKKFAITRQIGPETKEFRNFAVIYLEYRKFMKEILVDVRVFPYTRDLIASTAL